MTFEIMPANNYITMHFVFEVTRSAFVWLIIAIARMALDDIHCIALNICRLYFLHYTHFCLTFLGLHH